MGKVKQALLDIISFGSPQAIVFNLSVILVALAALPTALIQYSPFKCVFKHVILPLVYRGNCPTAGIFAGCECPACGLTRAMSRLLHGDITGALAYNRLVGIVLVVMIAVLAVNVVKMVRMQRKQ
ncbi:MAG: DUF2752 domain-containing protein [Nanoarchaeota archaeon]|nr:DUF2752 domain-containing protein [Nanoarchaeota archaeon]